MDLTKDKWLPVIFSNGDKKKISLRDLLDNRIQDLAYPRADFQGGGMANADWYFTMYRRAGR